MSAERDLDNLARWLPLIEGSALPPFPEYVAAQRVDVVGPRGELNPYDACPGASHLQALERPARHDGRPDHIDEHSYGLRRACATARRLEVLATQRRGAQHLAVLFYAYVTLGLEARRRLDRGMGFAAHVGLVLAEHRHRAAWLTTRNPRRGIEHAAARGSLLLDAAARAYDATAGVDATAGRLDLAHVRTVLATLEADARRDIARIGALRRRGEALPVAAPRRERRRGMAPAAPTLAPDPVRELVARCADARRAFDDALADYVTRGIKRRLLLDGPATPLTGRRSRADMVHASAPPRRRAQYAEAA